MKKYYLPHLTLSCLSLALLLPKAATAAPYASELSVSAGSVSFTLNESADSVKVIFGSTTNDLGSLAKGSYTTNVGASGVVTVAVEKNAGLGWKTAGGSNFVHTLNGVSVSENWAGKFQISADTNLLTRYPTPRGVAVNNNPSSSFFGRVYVANSTTGTTATRPVGKGLYIMKSDLSDSPLAYGNAAQGGGLTNYWGPANSGSSPYMITVGDDGYVYLSDFADASSILARMTPDLTFGELVLAGVGGPSTLPIGQNHGSTKKVVTTGSIAGGDLKLYTLDEDYTGDCMNSLIAAKNSIWRYDVNSGPLTNADCGTLVGTPAPSWLATGTQDFTVGTNGYIYAIQNRSAGAEPGLFVMDAVTGVTVWDSLSAYRGLTGIGTDNDVMVNLESVAVSPDHKYLALGLVASAAPGASDTWIIPLLNGLPDLANRLVLDSGSVAQGRGVAFDLAGNLYTISSGDAVLRVFSPGGFTVAKTGSDGSFALVLPSTTVTVAASVSSIAEGGAVNFSFTRVGSTGGPLTVGYSLSGTANNGADYATLPGVVTFAAGAIATNVTLTASADGIPEFTENVVLSILPNPGFSVGSPGAAAVAITDADPATLQLATNAPSMYERHTNDYAGVKLQRLGDVSMTMTIDLSNFTFTSSSAVLGVDYLILSNSFPITLDPGVLVTNVNLVAPLDNGVYSGNKSIVVGLTAGDGFLATSSNVILTILDDENPSAPVLYANPLTSAADALNWNLTYANNDMVNLGASDYEASFGFDLTTAPGGAVAPPPGGANNALRVTVNKSVAAAAGVNLYPTNVSFSGDYAVRFNMNVIIDTAAGTTHGPVFGINHSGFQTNWWTGSGIVSGGPNWSADGVWAWVSADGGAAAGDYIMYTGLGGILPNTGWVNPVAARVNDSFVNVFKGPPAPFSGYAGPGLIANDPPAFGADNYNWSDVEIKQLGSVVSVTINKIRILTYTNSTSFTNGTIMLGYDDPFSSVGEVAGAAYFANLSVVRLGGPIITSIDRNGANVTIGFTSNDGSASAASFALQSASVVSGPYADVAGAAITQSPSTAYQATATSAASAQFYRIRVR